MLSVSGSSPASSQNNKVRNCVCVLTTAKVLREGRRERGSDAERSASFNGQTAQHNKQTESVKLNHAARTLICLHSNRSLRNNVQMIVQYIRGVFASSQFACSAACC